MVLHAPSGSGYINVFLQNVFIEHACFNNYLAIVRQDIICIKFHEKVYVRSNRRCCVVDSPSGRDLQNQYHNSVSIMAEDAGYSSSTLRKRFNVTEIRRR